MLARKITLAVCWLVSLLAVLLVGGGVMLAAHVWLVAPANGAPVPVKKPVPKITARDLVGEWALTWGAGRGVCTLGAAGDYYETWYGCHFVGHWWLDRNGRKLHVRSFLIGPDGITGEACNWNATLKPGRREGTLDNEGAFWLAPVERKKPDA